MTGNSRAYQGVIDLDDSVHDYERKAPPSNWDTRRMFRKQPPSPTISTDYRPDDALDLVKALNENKPSIIPTCDLPETYFHIMRHVDGSGLKLKVSASEDIGWSRIEVDYREGKLAREIARQNFPELF